VIEEEVWRNINIPEAEMRKYYEAHKADFVRTESVMLRMILVSTGDGKPETVAAALKKANSLLERARSGTDKFSDLARQYSDDPSAADDGLLPTPFERGKGADPKRELNKAIEDIVFNHEKGYVTDVIQIRGAGFAIYRVEDHIAAGQASFEDVKGQINEHSYEADRRSEAARVSDRAFARTPSCRSSRATSTRAPHRARTRPGRIRRN
jgi:peptidyl-prolyl cis-trans isomerase SurA